MAFDDEIIITDEEKDSLYSMPLGILPLETKALRPARLVKNARLETMVELFSNAETGSGQLAIQDLPREFNWEDPKHPDLRMISKLGHLNSYDVFSMRLTLRALEIDLTDIDALKLSEAKTQELATYMRSFTHPLILQIFGDDEASNINSFDDIIGLFRNPNKGDALDRLKQMAKKLGLQVTQVPTFLEDYGDIFLALSYYRQCLDQIEPIISEFLEGLTELRKSYQFKDDLALLTMTKQIEAILNEGTAGLTGRFEAFDRASSDMWKDISADRFRKVEKLIRSSHETNGGVLCALWVKMNVWATAFPNAHAGSPNRRVELLQSEMKQGIEKISILEKNAPKLSELN
ncbi:MAG: hypothetical protein HON65_15295 [Rhodospirillales bacterium]|jgi:hypothetical protein|nr:hypothetical protein [Rhodospirillales bacterium]